MSVSMDDSRQEDGWFAAIQHFHGIASAYYAVLLMAPSCQINTNTLPMTASAKEPIKRQIQDACLHNAYRMRKVPLLLRSGFASDLDVIRSGSLDKNDYYREFIQPFNLKWCVGLKILLSSKNGRMVQFA